MADNTYRTSRRDTAAPGGQQFDDPLAELARLIGQQPPANAAAERAPQHHAAPPLDAHESDQQWPADPRYADQYPEQYEDPQSQYAGRQGQYGEAQYSDSQYDDRQYSDSRDTPRPADPTPPYRAAPPSYNADYEQPVQPAAPAQAYDSRGYAERPRYDDEHDSIQDLPAFLPRLREESAHGRAQVHAQGYAQNYGDETYAQPGQSRYEQGDYEQDSYGQGQSQDQGYEQGYDQQQSQPLYEQRYAEEDAANDQAYALEDYEEQDEAPAPKRRGFAIAAAALGILVLGAAGVFGYRTMFGGSLIPSLPPIIKADGTPNKIVPATAASNSSGQTNAGAGGDKLVSREEKPVDVPAPANTPRVVSTIPVSPDSNAALQSSAMPGYPNMAQQSISGAVAPGIAGAGAPGGPISLGPTAAPVYAPTAAPPAFPQQTAAAPAQGQVPVAGTTNSKKIHTVPIHAGQDNPDAASAAAPAQTQAAPAPAAATTAAARNQAARAAAAKPVAAAPSGGQNGPLSIVPSQGGGDTTPHTRTALARPTTEPAPSSGGGVFVQLSSQRSEAEAQSAYRDMQARFPSQLGGHAPTVRQVTFPDKGTFYRTLIGPFASREQATQMCASLKAAGGTCLVQRN